MDPSLLRRSLIGIAAVLIVAIGAFLFIFLRAGPLGPDDQAKAVVAAIGLVGVIFTGCVTALGLFLKDSIDRRAQATALDAEARLRVSAREAEDRLRADTSLKAIELMTADKLSPAMAAERREGAILALASLGYYRLVLRLCDRFLKEGSVPPELVVIIANDCLKSDDEDLHSAAASMLRRHAARLPGPSGYLTFPRDFYTNWKSGLRLSARVSLLEALVHGMLARPLQEWAEHVPNQFAYTLFKMMTVDDNDPFRATAALFSIQLYRMLEGRGKTGNFASPDRIPTSHREIYDLARKILNVSEADCSSEQALVRALRRDPGRGLTGPDFQLALKIHDWADPQTEKTQQ